MNVEWKCLAALIAVFMTFGARAATFNLDFSVGGDSNVFPSGSYAILVADTGNNGFQALSDSFLLTSATNMPLGTLLGSDDVIILTSLTGLSLVDFGTGQDGFSFGNITFDTSQFPSVPWTAGDPLALFWFQSGSSNEGDPFGFYRSDVFDAELGATIAFETPENGNSRSIVDLSTTFDGNTSPEEYLANNGVIVVPEPSVCVLLLMAALFLSICRIPRRSG